MEDHDVTVRTLRLGRERSLELDTASELNADDRDALEHERLALFLWAGGLAERTRTKLAVARDSHVADLLAFIDNALALDAKNAKRVECRVFGGRLTATRRRQLHQAFPGFRRLSAPDLLDAGARGYRGEGAIRFALRGHAPVTRETIPVTVGHASRPRERGSRSARRASPSSDDGPLPPPLRRHLAQLISDAKLAWIANKKVCGGCDRWLSLDEFCKGQRRCRTCKAFDQAQRRARKVAA